MIDAAIITRPSTTFYAAVYKIIQEFCIQFDEFQLHTTGVSLLELTSEFKLRGYAIWFRRLVNISVYSIKEELPDTE